jgi:hypothetical protein
VARVHGCALHADLCTAGCEAHMIFADKSACLTADEFRNEVVSEEMLTMLSSIRIDIFAINCFLKKHMYSNSSCTYSTSDTNFHWMALAIVLTFLH